MAREKPRGGVRVTSNIEGNLVLYHFTFTTAGASASDGLDPTSVITSGAPASGVHPFTFDSNAAPVDILWCSARCTNDPQFRAEKTGYVSSTGILSLTVYQEDATTKLYTVDTGNTSDNDEFEVLMLCQYSSIS